MSYLILLRHGESLWNKQNLFTGWVDVPLSPQGIEEALAAGTSLNQHPIDIVYCSSLNRAITTAMLALAARGGPQTPVIHHEGGKLQEWGKIYSEETLHKILPVYIRDALNERMYGELQGLNKRETMDRFGAEQVQLWRRSYNVAPPQGESLELTLKRTLPCFLKEIEPQLKRGKNVLIVAHGNSLRSIIKHLEQLSDEAIVKRELATGIPITYKWDGSYTLSTQTT